MPRRQRSFGLIAAGIAVAVVLSLAWPDRAADLGSAASAGALRSTAVADSGNAAVSADTGSAAATEQATAATPPADEHPNVKRFQEFSDFQERTRDFLAKAAQLAPGERVKLAGELRNEVLVHEKEGQLVPVESLLLQLALTRLTAANDSEYRREAHALSESHKARSQSAEQAVRATPDPRFTDYKTREAAIVKEVMAMTSIPGGASREDYLRERLDQARIEAYRSRVK
jgi:hypothetical protein